MQHIYEMESGSPVGDQIDYALITEGSDEVSEVFDTIEEAAAYCAARGDFTVHTLAGWVLRQQEEGNL